MTKRLQFVAACAAGEETMAELCRQFGISRKTGYKWRGRVRTEGAAGLVDRSRAPRHRPQTVSPAVREAVLGVRGAHPTWGPKKLAAKLAQEQPELRVPAPSTIGDLVRAAGLVVPRSRRRRAPARTQPLAHAVAPNAVWSADFKGDFALGDGTRCYPLTISDGYSRYLLRCQALPVTTTARVQPLFAATFREYGLPVVLRTDNGPPFASTGVGGLTALSVWWVKLGIVPERIDPGKPAQNGRHERMHQTLKAEACDPPGQTLAEQQRQCDRFRTEYNQQRPHEALSQVPPASVYTPSVCPYSEHRMDVTYSGADAVRWVRPNGALRWQGDEVYLGQVLSGEPVGLTQVADQQWELRFGPVLLGRLEAGKPTLIVPARSRPRRHDPHTRED